jgi:hypothetical protein
MYGKLPEKRRGKRRCFLAGRFIWAIFLIPFIYTLEAAEKLQGIFDFRRSRNRINQTRRTQGKA